MTPEEEDNWKKVAKWLQIPFEDIMELKEKDPIACLEKLFTAKEAMLDKLDPMAKDLQKNPQTGKLIWEDFTKMRAYVNDKRYPKEVTTGATSTTYAFEVVRLLTEEGSIQGAFGEAAWMLFNDISSQYIELKQMTKEVEEIEQQEDKIQQTTELFDMHIKHALRLSDKIKDYTDKLEVIQKANDLVMSGTVKEEQQAKKLQKDKKPKKGEEEEEETEVEETDDTETEEDPLKRLSRM